MKSTYYWDVIQVESSRKIFRLRSEADAFGSAIICVFFNKNGVSAELVTTVVKGRDRREAHNSMSGHKVWDFFRCCH